MPKKLSHYDGAGRARMVDVSGKSVSKREAEASGFVSVSQAVLSSLPSNPKGDPLEVARIAGIMFPGMLPPPTPFKVFVLAAAAFEMKFREFIFAVFAGRFVRFLVLSVLVLWFGPQIISHFGGIFKQHWMLLSGFILEIGLLLWLLARTRRPKKTAVPPSENGGDQQSEK